MQTQARHTPPPVLCRSVRPRRRRRRPISPGRPCPVRDLGAATTSVPAHDQLAHANGRATHHCTYSHAHAQCARVGCAPVPQGASVAWCLRRVRSSLATSLACHPLLVRGRRQSCAGARTPSESAQPSELGDTHPSPAPTRRATRCVTRRATRCVTRRATRCVTRRATRCVTRRATRCVTRRATRCVTRCVTHGVAACARSRS